MEIKAMLISGLILVIIRSYAWIDPVQTFRNAAIIGIVAGISYVVFVGSWFSWMWEMS